MKHGGIMLLQIVVTAAAFGMSFAIRKGEQKSPTLPRFTSRKIDIVSKSCQLTHEWRPSVKKSNKQCFDLLCRSL